MRADDVLGHAPAHRIPRGAAVAAAMLHGC
eukprot:COSAG01_NODE_47567_length_389_cov_0.731034_1_plen_29_part_10